MQQWVPDGVKGPRRARRIKLAKGLSSVLPVPHYLLESQESCCDTAPLPLWPRVGLSSSWEGPTMSVAPEEMAGLAFVLASWLIPHRSLGDR